MTPITKNPVGARVKLRVEFGDPPPVPCVLLTASGRRYDVIGSRGKTLTCIVCSPDDEIEPGTPVLQWTWTAKNKRVEP